MFARIFALLLVTFLFILPANAFAKSDTALAIPAATALPITNYHPSISLGTNLPATVSPASPLYTDLLIHNLFHSFSCLAVGQSVIGQPCLTYQITKNAQGAIQGVPILAQANLQGGALGAVTGIIGGLYQNPPVRTADYLASVGQGLGIVEPANAQVAGSGQAVLNPILSLWQVSRNVSYVLLIIIFLIIGVMIMFRNKLNPQTVITAQTALPGLVIGLIMITFSYFFAGLISDMAFVGTNIVGYFFVSAQGKLNVPTTDKDAQAWKDQLELTQKLSGENILSLMAPLTGIITQPAASDVVQRITDNLGDALTPVRIVIFWLTAQFLMPIAGGIPPPFGLIAGPVLSLLGGGLVNVGLPFFLGFFLSFAAALALTYQMIKLLFKLIMAWLTIIFLTISAPFQFLFASLPGRQGMFTGWMLNMLANILIFPAVIAVLYFVAFILGPAEYPKHCTNGICPFKISNSNQSNSNGFTPTVYAAGEIIGPATFPLLGGMDLSFVKILLAFGALMALPTIPDLVTKSIGKGGGAGSAIGQEIMGGFGRGQGYAKQTYMGGVNWGQGAKTSILGEQQFSRNEKGRWVVTYGKPGARHWKDIDTKGLPGRRDDRPGGEAV